jgi:hypothetical protein
MKPISDQAIAALLGLGAEKSEIIINELQQKTIHNATGYILQAARNEEFAPPKEERSTTKKKAKTHPMAVAVATKVEALTCAVSSRGQPDGAVAVEKDSDMSIQERVDRRNTAWWLERKAKEQAKEQARLEQMRLGATSAFATSALIVVQPAPFSTLQEDTSAVSVVQPAPFSILQEHTQ